MQVARNPQPLLGDCRPGELGAGTAQHVQGFRAAPGAVSEQPGQRRDDRGGEGQARPVTVDDGHDQSGGAAGHGADHGGDRSPAVAAEGGRCHRQRGNPVGAADGEQPDAERQYYGQCQPRSRVRAQLAGAHAPADQRRQHDRRDHLEPAAPVQRAGQAVDRRLEQGERDERGHHSPPEDGPRARVGVRVRGRQDGLIGVHLPRLGSGGQQRHVAPVRIWP